MQRRHPQRIGRGRAVPLGLWLAIGVTGCLGGLDNELFVGEGSVQGQLEGALDSASAWVTVEDQPELVAAVAADGSFELSGVAAGERTLLASTGLDEASRQRLTVLARADNQVRLRATQGAVLRGAVSLAGDDLSRRPELGFQALPVRTKTEPAGEVELAGLPSGCFEVWASHPTHQRATREVCLTAGETATFSLRLMRSEGNGDSSGELCAPCSAGEDCSSGQCTAYSSSGADEQVCTQSCSVDENCPLGFRCEELEGGSGERICLPHEMSCTALANVGASCGEDPDCGLDDEDGQCVDGRCVARCEEPRDCPTGMQCVVESGENESICQ